MRAPLVRLVISALAVTALAGCGTASPGSRPGGTGASLRPRATAPGRPHLGAAAPVRERAALTRLIALGKPVYCGGRKGHEIALTFDDGPGRYTKFALRELRAAGDRATFFLVARSIARFPDLPRRSGFSARSATTHKRTPTFWGCQRRRRPLR